MELVRIEVTPDIASKIRFMAESGVFSITKGNATVNFDGGEIKSIKTELYTYPSVVPISPLVLSETTTIVK